MADTEVAAAPPATKEKKKKKSVKSSEKKSAPETNGDVVPAAPAEPGSVEVEAALELSLKKRPKFLVAAEVSVSETKPAQQEETAADPEKLSPSKPRPKFSWSVEADDVPSEDSVQLQLQPKKMSITPEPEPARKSSEPPKTEINQEKVRELAEAFYLLDFNQDGLIDKKDLQLTYATLGRVDVADTDIQHMLDEADSPLDFEAFVKLLGFKTIELDSEDILMKALALWDHEGTGLIPETRIRHDLMTWGDKFSEQEVEWALEDAPLYSHNEGTMLDYVEFCKALCGLRKPQN